MNYSVHQMIQENYPAVCMFLFLIIFLARNNNFEKRTRRLFMEATLLVGLLICLDAWEIFLSEEETCTFLHLTLVIAGYSLRPVVAFLIDLVAWKERNPIKRFCFSIPILVNTIAMCSAYFVPYAFYYTKDNVFHRGPLNFLPFATSIFYLLAIIIIGWKMRGQGRRGESHIAIMITVIAIGAAFDEAIFGFHCFLNASCLLGISFYYLYYHISINTQDALTNALNRRQFFLDIKAKKKKISGIISIDLNDLKKWNDQYGHQEGDRALTTLCETCRRYMPKFWRLYRTGGDEFEVIAFRSSEDSMKEFIKRVQERLASTNYTAAMGYAMNSDETTISEICKAADKRMYENKKQMKDILR